MVRVGWHLRTCPHTHPGTNFIDVDIRWHLHGWVCVCVRAWTEVYLGLHRDVLWCTVVLFGGHKCIKSHFEKAQSICPVMRSVLGFPDVLEEWNLKFQFSRAKLLWMGPHRTTFQKLGRSYDYTRLRWKLQPSPSTSETRGAVLKCYKTSQPERFAHSELFAIAAKT